MKIQQIVNMQPVIYSPKIPGTLDLFIIFESAWDGTQLWYYVRRGVTLFTEAHIGFLNFTYNPDLPGFDAAHDEEMDCLDLPPIMQFRLVADDYVLERVK